MERCSETKGLIRHIHSLSASNRDDVNEALQAIVPIKEDVQSDLEREGKVLQQLHESPTEIVATKLSPIII